MLVDRVELTLKAGKGGDGAVAWRREKFISKGGPDGGDGGRGGDVTIGATHNLDTLSHFRFQKKWSAQDGKNGSNKQKHGRKGEDLFLKVPVGTRVIDKRTSQTIVDLTEEGKQYVLAKGGKGGFGNAHFAHSTRQRPNFSTQGQIGETKEVVFQLELIADVAIVGPPNSGKSSLIKALTGVESRIGAYPFSTTEPILGVMNYKKTKLILLDLPGLIENAHQGKGMGDKFLQHLHRVKFVIYLIDAADNPVKNLHLLKEEIRKYEENLLSIRNLLVLNKIDLLSSAQRKLLKKQLPQAIFISAQTNEGIGELKKQALNIFKSQNYK